MNLGLGLCMDGMCRAAWEQHSSAWLPLEIGIANDSKEPSRPPLGSGAREYAVDLVEQRLSKAKERLDQLDEETRKRKRLRYQFLQEIDDEIWYLRFHFGQFNKFFGVGYNAGVDARRNQLERLLFAATERKRREELRSWEDLAQLVHQREEATKEYESLRRMQRAVEK